MLGRRQTIKAARRANAEGMISLAQRRVWHTQETGGGAGASSAATQNTEHMIPKSRFDEVNTELKTLREQMSKQQTEATEREQARLVEEGKWKELAETRGSELAKLTPYQERAQTLEKRMSDANKARIERVPEANRSRIPAKLSTEDLSDYLDANWEWLIGKPAPNTDAGAGGAGGAAGQVTLTADEKRIIAASGMTEAQWIAAKVKATQA